MTDCTQLKRWLAHLFSLLQARCAYEIWRCTLAECVWKPLGTTTTSTAFHTLELTCVFTW